MTWSIFSIRSDLDFGARVSVRLHSSPRWSGASHKAAESKHPSRFGKFDLLLMTKGSSSLTETRDIILKVFDLISINSVHSDALRLHAGQQVRKLLTGILFNLSGSSFRSPGNAVNTLIASPPLAPYGGVGNRRWSSRLR